MAGVSAETALRIWKEKGLLSVEQIEGLRAAIAADARSARSSRAIVIFSILGVILLGTGAMLFIASNWDVVPPWGRIALVLACYALVCAAAWLAGRHELSRVSESLWFLATLLLGVGIFLLAQIFNFSLTFWQGPCLWLLGTLAMAYARQRAYYVLLAVPLAVLTLGWLGGGSGWFIDDQLEFLASERGLLPLFGLIGVSCVSLGLVARHFRSWAFSGNALIALGSLMIALVLLATTVFDEVAEALFELLFTAKQLSIIGGTIVLVTLAALVGDLNHRGRGLLIVTTVLLLALIFPALGEPPTASPSSPLLGALFSDDVVAFALYVVFVFALSLATTGVGVSASNRFLVNVGIVVSALILFIRYFAWSFSMLPTSFAFISGGVVLIGISVMMERLRRRALARLEGN